MEGMSERQYAAHVGLSRGAIQKARAADRLVLHEDGSIDAAASDKRRLETSLQPSPATLTIIHLGDMATG